MTRAGLILACVAALACAPEPSEQERPVEITRSGDLVIESRPLPGDAAFAIVGLRPQAERDDGSALWDTSFSETAHPGRDGTSRRRFRLTIRNRSTSVLEFHARLDYSGADGLVRRRTLSDLVVPPLTEKSWISEVVLPPPGDMEPLIRVLPSSEPFEAEPSAGNPPRS